MPILPLSETDEQCELITDKNLLPGVLLDFEPAMRSNAEYDLAAAGIFLGRGDRAVWREFLAGHGHADVPGLPRRVFGH